MTITPPRSAKHAGPRARPPAFAEATRSASEAWREPRLRAGRRRRGSRPPRAPSSPSKIRQRHRKVVATPCPPVSRLARSSRSSRPRNARKPPCRRQISIDRTGRTAEPDPPAVSFPEVCPTPAGRVRGIRPATAGVRQPLTRADSHGLSVLCLRSEERADVERWQRQRPGLIDTVLWHYHVWTFRGCKYDFVTISPRSVKLVADPDRESGRRWGERCEMSSNG